MPIPSTPYSDSENLGAQLLSRQNKEAQFYFILLQVVLFLLPSLYLILMFFDYELFRLDNFCFYFLVKLPAFFLSIIDLSGLVFLIILFMNEKSRNWIKGLVTREIKVNPTIRFSSIHDTTSIAFRFILTVFLSLVILLLPGFLIHQIPIFDYLPINHFIGLIISFSIISIMILFLVNLMPDLILKKIDKDDSNHQEYRYIYWIYFFKSRLIESPVILLISIPLLALVVITLSILFFYGTSGSLLRVEFTLIGLLITLLITIATDFLRAYTKLTQVFNDYTNHLIKNRLILINRFSIIQLGYGNFGSTIISTLYLDYLHFLKKSRPEGSKVSPSKDFEIIIDRDFDLRLLSRSHIIVDKDTNKFEETFSDSSFNFKFGFFNCINFHSAEHDTAIDPNYIFGIPGISADGSNLGLWKILNFKPSPIIINTTSDQNLTTILRKYFESRIIKQVTNPTVITTINSEIIESQLLGNRHFTSFPINHTFYEALSIVQRLFILISKIGLDKLDKIHIFISIQKTTINDLLNVFKTNLQIFNTPEIVDKFISKNIFLDIHTSILHDTTTYNHFPNFMQTKTQTIKFDPNNNIIINDNDKSFYSLLQEPEITSNPNIFLVFANSPFLNLKILTEIRNMISSLNIDDSYMISSISEDYIKDAESILNSNLRFNVPQPSLSFLTHSEDFLLKKNLTISNQITSIISGYLNHNSKTSSEYFNLERSIIQLEICLPNNPLTLLQVLAQLKGFKLNIPKNTVKILPSLIYNFSYPILGDEGDKDMFILRADFTLGICNFNLPIPDLAINGILINPENEPLKGVFTECMRHLPTSACKFCTLIANPSSSSNTLAPEPQHSHSQTSSAPVSENFKQITGVGYIKIKSKSNSNPYSLLSTLLLLYKGNIVLEKIMHPLQPEFNIVYETGTICTSTKDYLHKFYVHPSAEQPAPITEEHPIESITIRFSDPDSPEWIEYVKELNSHFKASGKYIDLSFNNKELNLKKGTPTTHSTPS
jgi:hypothetical protein